MKIDVGTPMKFPFQTNKVIISTKKGLANARNDIMKRTKADWLLFLDSDVEINQQWWDAIRHHLDNPEVGAVHGFGLSGFPLNILRMLAIKLRTKHQRGYTSNTFIRVAAIKGITLERKGRLEDIELQDKIRANGFKWVFEPTAICKHTKSTWQVFKEAWGDFKILWEEKGFWSALKSI